MTDPELRALLAGTLALMTHSLLCGRREVPWELRATLAKLGARWSLLEDEARTSADRAGVRH